MIPEPATLTLLAADLTPEHLAGTQGDHDRTTRFLEYRQQQRDQQCDDQDHHQNLDQCECNYTMVSELPDHVAPLSHLALARIYRRAAGAAA